MMTVDPVPNAGDAVVGNAVAPVKKGRTRGKQWTQAELIALMEAYATVAFDSATGDYQKAEVFSEKIFDKFCSNYRAPTREDFDALPQASKEKTLWYGRGARSAKIMADTVRSECTAFHACYARVISMELTGNVSTEGLLMAAAYLLKGNPAERSAILLHLV